MEEVSKKKKRKSTNPLYVVHKNGVDVEEVSGMMAMLLKKTGIDKLMPFLETLFQLLFQSVNSYPMFLEVKKLMDKLMEKVIEVIFTLQQMMPKKIY